ncbi:MAG: ABC transporter ATP-binding protein [Actinobacteria bacterium]|nr:ABC transporter ATP-binding protein [Actinomycetota bacterium]
MDGPPTPPPPGAGAAPTAAAAGSTAAIVCFDLRKNYRDTLALAGVDLRVERGSVFGFLGPNGAGKSTLVKILTGLVHPSGGQVEVLGGKPGSRAVHRRLGYLPEQFRFPQWLTGRELLRLHARLMGVGAEDARLLELVGLDAAGDRRIGEYSKGMQQRLGLAQALVGDPELVFLDEPTSALDPIGRRDVRDILTHLRDRGMTVFLNSHLLTEVERVCDRLAVIDKGSVIAQGATTDLLQVPGLSVRVGELPVGAFDAIAALLPSNLAPPTYAAGVITLPGVAAGEVPAVVRTLVDAGLPVYEVAFARQSLEEAFVQLLQGRHPGVNGEARA